MNIALIHYRAGLMDGVSLEMERWKKVVEKRTNGKVKVETYPGGTLLGAKNMFDGVVTGMADIGCLCLPYQPGRFPLLSVVDLPIGFPNATVASLVLWDLYTKYKPKSFAKVKVLTMFTCPPANIMCKKPVRSLKDLKGLELRSTGAGAKVLSLLGATPVAMPMSETPEALQKGVVKGIFSSLEILKDFNFASLCRYETVCNLQTASFAVVMNLNKWKSLPKDVQKVINDLRREQALWTGKYVDKHVNESIAWSKKKYNIEVIHFSNADVAKMHKLLKPLTYKYLKDAKDKGVPGQAALNDLYKLKAKYLKKYAK